MPETSSIYELRGQLAKLSASQLESLAQAVGLGSSKAAAAPQLRKEILARRTDPGEVGAAIRKLPARQSLALAAVTMAGTGRTGPFLPGSSLEEMDLRADFVELARRGFLYPDPAFSYGRGPGYFVPTDVLPLYAQIAAHAVHTDRRPNFFNAKLSGESAGPELLAALLRVVGEVHRAPLKVTQQGTVYKRDMERLHAVRGSLAFSSASPAWGQIVRTLAAPAARDSTLPWSEDGRDVGMLLWTGLATGLLDVRLGSLVAAPGWQAAVQRAGRDELWRSSVFSLIELLINREIAALALFRLLDEKIWLTPLRWLDDVFSVPLRVRSVEARQAAGNCLLAAGELGLIEAAMIDGEPAVRLSPSGAAMVAGRPLPSLPLEGKARILPSGDLLLTDYAAPELQARLECYARPVKVDVVTTYRIEQGLVALAASEGTSAGEIRGFFAEIAQDGLPQPVAFRLEEWLCDVGTVQFLEVALIACDTHEMRTRVAAIPAVRKELVELLGDRWIVIPAAAQERLRAAMQQQGIIPAASVLRPSGLSSMQELRRQQRSPQHLGRLSQGVSSHGHRLSHDKPSGV